MTTSPCALREQGHPTAASC